MLHFMKSAPSQGQVNSPNAQPGPPAAAPVLPHVPSAAAELRPRASLPENGLWGREAAAAQALGEGDAGPRAWHWASRLATSLSLPAAPCPTLQPCAGSWLYGRGSRSPGRGKQLGRSQCVAGGPILLSWGSPWCGAGCYELAGLVKSSTPVMVALQKKQSLLFIRCWLMQALGQRRKEHELPPAPVALLGVMHTSYSLARFVGAGSEDGRDGMCVADGAQVFLTGGLCGGTRPLVVAAKTPCPRTAVPGSWGCCRAWGPGWGDSPEWWQLPVWTPRSGGSASCPPLPAPPH